MQTTKSAQKFKPIIRTRKAPLPPMLVQMGFTRKTVRKYIELFGIPKTAGLRQSTQSE